jgi:hypothetical protein
VQRAKAQGGGVDGRRGPRNLCASPLCFRSPRRHVPTKGTPGRRLRRCAPPRPPIPRRQRRTPHPLRTSTRRKPGRGPCSRRLLARRSCPRVELSEALDVRPGGGGPVLGHPRVDVALRLPSAGPLDSLDLRGCEVHNLGPRGQGTDLGLAALYRGGCHRIDCGFAVEDPWPAPRNLPGVKR